MECPIHSWRAGILHRDEGQRGAVTPRQWAYFDTSVLVKRYVKEVGSLTMRRLLRRFQLLSSSIMPVEAIGLQPAMSIRRSYAARFSCHSVEAPPRPSVLGTRGSEGPPADDTIMKRL